MIPQQDQDQTRLGPRSPQEIAAMVDQSNMQWVDQYNQNLILTVQALQNLHLAFEARFVR